jgi:hypothetical protein
MTDKQAIAAARTWVSVRKEVRRHLIAAARERHPRGGEGLWSTEERKLWNYPSDLSEARLLALIEE